MEEQLSPTTSEAVRIAPESWKNAPTIRDLKQDLTDALPTHRAQVEKLNAWMANMRGELKELAKLPKGNSKIVPKLIRKQAEWRYAALTEPFLSTEDLFNVSPVTWEDRDAARQNQLLLNNQINTKIDKVKFIDEYVRTAVDEGTVVVQVGWAFEEEEILVEKPKVAFRENPAMAPMHEHLAQLRKESPSQWETDVPEELKQAHEMTLESGLIYEPVVIGYESVPEKRVLRNHPTLDVCDSRNVVFDPTCMGDYEKARFAIKTFESSLAELEAAGKYQNLHLINIDNNSILSSPDHNPSQPNSSFNFSDKPRKKFVVHEYWGYWDVDGSSLVKPFVAAWVGDVLIRLEENPFPDKKIPFVVEQYLPVRKQNYGEPDGALLEDNQRIIGAVVRGMIDIMGKSANGQTGLRKDMLDSTNKRKYDAGQDYEFNANVDPRQGVYMHTFPEIPQSAPFMLQLQNMEAESLTGVKSFSSGISGQSLGDVAAGVRGALDAASKRELGILRRLSNGMVKIGRKIIAMNSEFLSEKEVIRVTNEDFVAIRRDDLGGNFDLKLSISTAEEDNNKAQELGFMLQTIGPDMDPTLRQMVLADIARLRKMPDVARRIEHYKPEPDALAIRKAELEIQLLEAKLQNELALAQERGANAQLNQAKVGTELAKAGKLQSDKDLADLDFVEQESGVKQERDLQKQGEQARAQAQMKLMEHRMQLIRDRLKPKRA